MTELSPAASVVVPFRESFTSGLGQCEGCLGRLHDGGPGRKSSWGGECPSPAATGALGEPVDYASILSGTRSRIDYGEPNSPSAIKFWHFAAALSLSPSILKTPTTKGEGVQQNVTGVSPTAACRHRVPPTVRRAAVGHEQLGSAGEFRDLPCVLRWSWLASILHSPAVHCLPLQFAAFQCLPLPFTAFDCLPLPSTAVHCRSFTADQQLRRGGRLAAQELVVPDHALHWPFAGYERCISLTILCLCHCLSVLSFHGFPLPFHPSHHCLSLPFLELSLPFTPHFPCSSTP